VLGDGDLHALVARARDLEEDLVLPLEQDLAIIRAPRREHRAVHALELLGGQAAVALARSAHRGLASAASLRPAAAFALRLRSRLRGHLRCRQGRDDAPPERLFHTGPPGRSGRYYTGARGTGQPWATPPPGPAVVSMTPPRV
jgi:hypothetical protein